MLREPSFEGDADNFNFPRDGFDAAFLRVWDGATGQPLKTDTSLPWAKQGAREGDLVFVSGHPGGTERQSTVAELEFQRDVALPYTLLHLAEPRGLLCEYASNSPERWRTTRARLRSMENSLKALRGRQQALAEPALLEGKRRAEAELRAKVDGTPGGHGGDLGRHGARAGVLYAPPCSCPILRQAPCNTVVVPSKEQSPSRREISLWY